MIRQVRSYTSKPFRSHVIDGKTIIAAVDFDMGPQRIAYYDTDTARYQYTPGVNTEGNRGHTYRNDGVDIERGKEGPHVFRIEDGEWLQYTVTVKKAGKYTISFKTASATDDGLLSMTSGNKTLVKDLSIKNTGDAQNWQWLPVKDISLQPGTHSFRVLAGKGGFNFAAIQIEKQ
jgi:hypothetical protein